MTERTADAVVVADNPERRRFEARLGDEAVGFSAYRLDGDHITFTHTEVDPAVEGRGIGSRLARGVLDDARSRGLAVTVECPFIGAWLRRHEKEYADLRRR
jgi:predicted GNAT family acetyltransferase